MLKQQSLMTHFGNISYESIEKMTPFERRYFNEVVTEAKKEQNS